VPFTEAISRGRKYIILLTKRCDPGVDQFFEDPIKVRQQRNRPIIVWISVIVSFKDRNNFAIFNLLGYIPDEREIFIISASVLLITLDKYFNSWVGHEYKALSTRIRIFSNPQLFRSGYGYRPHVSSEFDTESGKK